MIGLYHRYHMISHLLSIAIIKGNGCRYFTLKVNLGMYPLVMTNIAMV